MVKMVDFEHPIQTIHVESICLFFSLSCLHENDQKQLIYQHLMLQNAFELSFHPTLPAFGILELFWLTWFFVF